MHTAEATRRFIGRRAATGKASHGRALRDPKIPRFLSPMTVTVAPVTVAMPTEKEVEARTLRVVPRVAVIMPICTAAMVVAPVPPAAPIVDRFCCSPDAYADVLEAGTGAAEAGAASTPSASAVAANVRDFASMRCPSFSGPA